LYGTNLVNLLKLMTPGKDGTLVLDFDDVVQRSVTVVRQGESTWPPPPVQVSAAPAAAGPAKQGQAAVAASAKPANPAVKRGLIGGGLAAFFLILATAPSPLPTHFATLMLAIVIGYYVIGHVAHALHTPLMSVTNAISGIVVVGAMMQIGSHDRAVTILSAVAVLLASINIFGGFAVTRRMLAMFRKGD
jgi:H+-translocating NAD(P) transhydrogenase subunit alpha